MKNSDVVQMFLDGSGGRTANLYIDGNVLYSYGKHFPLAVRKGNTIYVNVDKYSQTTSCHQGLLRRGLLHDKYYSRIDCGTTELVKMIEKGKAPYWNTPEPEQLPEPEPIKDYFGKEI